MVKQPWNSVGQMWQDARLQPSSVLGSGTEADPAERLAHCWGTGWTEQKVSLDLRPHTLLRLVRRWSLDAEISGRHFSWNTSLFPPQNSSSLPEALPSVNHTSWVFKRCIRQKWGTRSSACQEPDFVCYTLYKKPLLLLSQYSGERLWIILKERILFYLGILNFETYLQRAFYNWYFILLYTHIRMYEFWNKIKEGEYILGSHIS